jgi:hypothetical protein
LPKDKQKALKKSLGAKATRNRFCKKRKVLVFLRAGADSLTAAWSHRGYSFMEQAPLSDTPVTIAETDQQSTHKSTPSWLMA